MSESIVEAIEDSALINRWHLVIVILNDELEEIGEYAFVNCILLERIVITSVVKTIKGMAFYNCTGLTTVTLGDELEEIGESAFGSCASLQRIVMPNVNAFKTIEKETFRGCLGLTTIILGEGLEEIGEGTFGDCESLERIVIPPAIKTIKDDAYYRCFKFDECYSYLAMGWRRLGKGHVTNAERYNVSALPLV